MAPRKRTQSNKKKSGKSSHKNSTTKVRVNPGTPNNTGVSQDEALWDEWNFVAEAGPGCHIARRNHTTIPPWVLEWEDVDPEDFDIDESKAHGNEDDQPEGIPDIAVDPDEQTLSVCNLRSKYVVALITIFDRTLRGRGGRILSAGTTRSDEDEQETCTTLIVLCPPRVFVHLCHIEGLGESLEDLKMESDVRVWRQHPEPDDFHPRALGFPLKSKQSLTENDGGGCKHPRPTSAEESFLCTQGVGGHLTHFLVGNLHAIDFRCPSGTPLLAVGDGVVIHAEANHRGLTGIRVTNLFQWNSILIQLDPLPQRPTASDGVEGARTAIDVDPLFVEYVHIASTDVQKGDRVQKGQVIGSSGGIGFSPEDHLHFAAYRSCNPDAPTVGFRFQARDGHTFLPKAGRWYSADGEVSLV